MSRVQQQIDNIKLPQSPDLDGPSSPGPGAGAGSAPSPESVTASVSANSGPSSTSVPSGQAPTSGAGASGAPGAAGAAGGAGAPGAGAPQGSGGPSGDGPASSQHLLDDPKLKQIMLSDVGMEALLARLKQSIVSTREFASFVKKQAQLESEHYMAMKKAARNMRESLRKNEGRQGTYAHQTDEIIKMNERTADVGNTFVAALHIMHDELVELAKSTDRSRKTIKESCLRNEKNVHEAEATADKAQAKYDQLAEEFERMRTGDPTKNKFGFKQSRTAQHEEELHKKVTVAEGEYQQKVTNAQRLRQELENKLRPVSARELRQLTGECDAGLALQLQKYTTLNETRALNSGFIISPLAPKGSSTAPLSMKQLASKIDNDLDFYNYVLAAGKGKALNRKVPQFRQHPSLAAAYPAAPKPAPIPAPAPAPASAATPSPAPAQAPAPVAPVHSTTASSIAPTTSAASVPQQPSSRGVSPAPGTSGFGAAGERSSPAPIASPVSGEYNGASQTQPQNDVYPPGTSVSSQAMPSYGVPLEDLLDYEQGTVPRVVYQCVQAIDNFGLEVEGIYRTNGNTNQVAEIRRLFDTDSASVNLLRPNPHLNDIHAVASALKQYFNELPDPLLTEEFHEEFIQGAKIDNDVHRRDSIHATINKLPDPNYTTLRYLVFHLYRVQEREAINRMSIVNLGIVWGPTLMAVDYQKVEEMALVGKILETILINAYVIFDAE